MLSRVAESIYWMNRYVERAENVARFIEVNLNLALDSTLGAGQWDPLIWITGDEALFAQRYGRPTAENVLQFLTFDPEYPSSILSCLRGARENARQIRETISSEMWQQLNSWYLNITSAAAVSRAADEPNEFFSAIRTAGHLFHGITDGTMSHSEGWHFGQIGRLLERADKTSRILDVKYFILLPRVEDVGTTLDSIQWASLLRSVSALEMYRKRFNAITSVEVPQFLILDQEFPRAVLYCLSAVQQSLTAIVGSPGRLSVSPVGQRIERLRSKLLYTSIKEIMSTGLHEYLDALQCEMNLIDEDVRQAFFENVPEVWPSPELIGTQQQQQQQQQQTRAVE